MKLEDKILEHRRLHEMQPILEGVTSFFESLSKDYGFEERLGQKLLSFDITKAIITNKCLIGSSIGAFPNCAIIDCVIGIFLTLAMVNSLLYSL